MLGPVIRPYVWLIAAAMVLSGMTALYVKIKADGAASVRLEQLETNQTDNAERKRDDKKTQDLSDFDLCVRDLGRVPICDSLK